MSSRQGVLAYDLMLPWPRPIRQTAVIAGQFAMSPTEQAADGLFALSGPKRELVLVTVGGNLHQDPTAGAVELSAPAPPAFLEEVPAGAVDGINPAFALSRQPDPPASLMLWRSGLLCRSGIDYTVDGAVVLFSSPPQSGALFARYRVQP